MQDEDPPADDDQRLLQGSHRLGVLLALETHLGFRVEASPLSLSVAQSKSTSETTRQLPFQLFNVKTLTEPRFYDREREALGSSKGRYCQNI